MPENVPFASITNSIPIKKKVKLYKKFIARHKKLNFDYLINNSEINFLPTDS